LNALPEPQHNTAVTRLHAVQDLSDLGNAKRLVETHGRDLRFEYAAGRWLVWDGRRWAYDESGAAERHAKDVASGLLLEAGGQRSDDERRRFAKHALHSMNAAPLRAMLSLAQSEPGIPVQVGDLDPSLWHLNVANGLLDLRNGRLEPHNRNALATRIADIAYDPAATAPTFESFLYRVFAGDQQLIGFLQRLVGYCLTGSTAEQILVVLHGRGANGKSTLVELLRDLLGDYATTMPPDLLVQRRDGAPQPHGLVRLRGARLVAATETEDGARLSVALVKQLTGGDTITARRLYGEFFDFRPVAKFVLSTNHKPVIRDSTESIWRRVRLIPFEVTVPPAERDPKLPERLRAELPGVLAWAVRGCLAWQEGGLGQAAAVDAATGSYRADSDPLGEFLTDCCLVGEHFHAPASLLYSAWRQWADGRGEQPGSSTALGRRLTERGFTPGRTGSSGARIWRGIALTTDTSDRSDRSPEEVL